MNDYRILVVDDEEDTATTEIYTALNTLSLHDLFRSGSL